ncbi:MAG: phosphogluconate dehydratase [Sphingomonadales bacterium 35-56-22]|jgi:phosphogluconate dehydratase|uniref:phosphogluconate dehydratase n=1 Tax=Sphingorhabdus sp. TaxID=1902408 RepID=UPI000BDA6654|nr:phosphogluconate dehydratase [Sphingorhabdus sp.]OYY16121.1 MAG: phosphogluconate dehydratase [Sphingomonadales bacterium 35-56-22]OYY97691.1 MAG: phosphogluconate dehydratase [Sphingomonadales bacterium 28-56-43]OYZ61903.1 MAG: phosphogluconate dehydratase [Sphingomonadales bacterium 24-56-14]OZA84122.1 MAG: phosphogluconate dehydratase [Sphingomonadales bacterium 39-57-19]HQS11793.1 phosphogluconate dehydratase [Sphingorhabdus sp.]
MSKMHPTVEAVTARIIERSKPGRQAYLDLIAKQRDAGVNRPTLSCGNLAHGFAASGEDKPAIRGGKAMNIGIVSAYNDMLSAHQPYGRYPEQMKIFAREVGATAQVAGAVPAMCDGVTQGQDSMELSLFSRDVIAMATAVGLSHGMFESVAMLGICDKIVPGLLIGALRFGHLPTILVPAGPMPSGLANKEKQRVRQLYAEGKVGRAELLEAEAASYHGAGTCTFYGTANSNQMMMEVMGLHIPGAAFINPGNKLRTELTRAAVHRLSEIGWDGDDYRPLGLCVDEKAIVNACVGLLATGGSTNHALHIPAIARAAGIVIDWEDLDQLSAVVPLIARVYPNGSGDVNHFHAAGGIGYVIRELIDAGLLHRDIMTVAGKDLADYGREPMLEEDKLVWRDAPAVTADDTMLRPPSAPFSPDGGMRLVTGNLGRATFKTSAVDPARWTIEAPVRVFHEQNDVLAAFKAGELDRDVIVVIRFQGPAANGMPELHKLTPPLGVLQDKGFNVALVTDGRMSGASGKVPAAIHLSPEAARGGAIAKLQDGDIVRLCATNGTLSVLVDDSEWADRAPAPTPVAHMGTGRELFAMMRATADEAEKGGSAMLAAAGL